MQAEAIRIRQAPVSGNGTVVHVREHEGAWAVRFMSEPRTSPQPLWFHFECVSHQPRPVRFEWANADSCLGLGSAEQLGAVRPVLRQGDAPWRRVGETAVLERESGGHMLALSAPQACEDIALAFCYPYGPGALHRTLKELGGVWDEEPIGLTGEGRLLPRLRASAPQRAPVAYVLARQHAGETPGSWVLDGLLRAVAAAAAEQHGEVAGVQWWVVPFVDLDGAVAGNYGKDAMPWDFNRAWSAMPMRPEVGAIQNDMRRAAARSDRRFALDLHAPGGGEWGLYQFLPREGRPDGQRKHAESFTPALADHFPEADPEQLARVPTYPSRWNVTDTLTNWAWDHLDRTPAVSIETSYQGLWSEQPLEPEDYREVGARIARAVAAWLLG